MLVFLRKILDSGCRSVSVIGMGKNTGKTFTFNQIIVEATQLGIKTAMTTIGLDGEARDALFQHDKPKILIRPGQIVANAASFLAASGLDYEILGTTGIMTPLGEVVLARALSAGETMLAGPGSRSELALVKRQLEELGTELFVVDGAVDRRSLAAPMVTDTTVFAAGCEASWDRRRLLVLLRHQLRVLQLPAWKGLTPNWEGSDLRLVLLREEGVQAALTDQEFFQSNVLAEYIDSSTQAVFVVGMLTDAVLDRILACAVQGADLTIVVQDPTCVFLSEQGFRRLASRQAVLKVLDSIHLSAVTVNPFNSRYGLADPLRLLADVGREVYPIPAYDLNLGICYKPDEEDTDAVH